jgi:hypothetical protein
LVGFFNFEVRISKSETISNDQIRRQVNPPPGVIQMTNEFQNPNVKNDSKLGIGT